MNDWENMADWGFILILVGITMAVSYFLNVQ